MPGAFFEKEISRLRDALIQMGGAVERMLDSAVAALEAADPELAEETIRLDQAVNDCDVRLTNKTILLIATNQPVAGDLRFLASSLKIIGELERIGDLSANVARQVRGAAEAPVKQEMPEKLSQLAVLTRTMLGDAQKSFVRRNLELARDILERDNQLDELNREIRRDLVERIAADGPLVHWGLKLIKVAAALERLGDHVTNLAEEIIYINSGRNVRHCGSPSALRQALAECNRSVHHEDLED